MNQNNLNCILSNGTGQKHLQNHARKLYIFLFYFFVLLFTISRVQAQETLKVAVFDPAGKVDEALLEIVREEISSVVVNMPGYTVLERQLINKVLEENKFQESGLVNDEQMSDIGKRMGADYVFVTTISRIEENYYISCKMIEVATARIDKQSTSTSTNGLRDVPQTTQAIVKRMFGENEIKQEINKQNENPIKIEHGVRRYKGMIDLGYTFSSGYAEKGRFELSTSHGYQMNQYLFVGLGLGLHMFSSRDPNMKLNMTTADKYPRYADPEEEISTAEGQTLLATSYEHGMDSSFMFAPVFVDVRAYLPISNSIVSPFASIKSGYAFNLTDSFGLAGFYFALSIGAKFDISPKIGLFLNIGYTFQGLGESSTIKRVTESGGTTTTTLVRSEGYGYYYRDQVGGNLYKMTSARGFNIRFGIEF